MKNQSHQRVTRAKLAGTVVFLSVTVLLSSSHSVSAVTPIVTTKTVTVRKTTAKPIGDDHPSVDTIDVSKTPAAMPATTETVRPSSIRLHHDEANINTYAGGNRIVIPAKTSQSAGIDKTASMPHEGDDKDKLESVLIVGKDDKDSGTDKSDDRSGDRSDDKSGDKSGSKSKDKTADSQTDDTASRIAGADGDSGGGGTSAAPSGSNGPEIDDVTTEQSKQFINIVRSNFKNWDLNQDHQLSLSEVKQSLQKPQIDSKEQAALQAIHAVSTAPSPATVSGTSSNKDATSENDDVWTLHDFEAAIRQAQQTNHSPLVRKFAEQAHLIDDRGTDVLGSKVGGANSAPHKHTPTGPVFTLGQGSVLVAHQKLVTVHTQLGQVYVSPGASAYVMQVGNSVAIYNLGDIHDGDVRVVVANKVEYIPVGQELLLTPTKEGEFKTLNPSKSIACRNIKPVRTIKNVRLITAEFSPITALDHIGQFRELLSSKDALDRNIAHQIVKSAAISLSLRQPFDTTEEK